MIDHLSPQMRGHLEQLVGSIALIDGVRPTNESADLVIAGQRPGTFLLATDDDGQVVGFAIVDERDEAIQVGVDGNHRRRGHGSALLRGAFEARPEYSAWAFGTLPGAEGLAASLGLHAVRELLQMGRPLGGEAAPVVPQGWVIRTFRPEDAEGIVATNAAAFVHHPEQGKLTVDEFRDLTGQPWFSADGLLVITPASATDSIAGFHWTKRQDDTTGEVYVLAVHPEHSGHGLGRVLLEAGLAHLEATGCTEVTLFVEASEERVVQMYRSASFVTSNIDTSYRS